MITISESIKGKESGNERILGILEMRDKKRVLSLSLN